MSLVELKSCPFCGNDTAFLDIKNTSEYLYSRVKCKTCGCQTEHYRQDNIQGGCEFIEMAVKSWNTRDGKAETSENNEQLESENRLNGLFGYCYWDSRFKEQPKYVATRISNALVRNDIRNMDHLYTIMCDGKTKIKNLGPNSLCVVAEMLIKEGYDEKPLKKYLNQEGK